MTDSNWDLAKYYWPKERVIRWWEQNWDWESLCKKKCPHPDYAGRTYADFYNTPVTIIDPHTKQEITDIEYWKKYHSWIIEFDGKMWTPYHLPIYDKQGIKFSPKRVDGFSNTILGGKRESSDWSKEDFIALESGLAVRMETGSASTIFQQGIRNAPLSGVIVPPNSNLYVPIETVYVDFSYSLFGFCCNFSKYRNSDTEQCPMKFGDNAKFYGCCFSNNINFNNCKFGNDVIFEKSYFVKESKFHNTHFKMNASFLNTEFHGGLEFSSSEFGDFADFTSAVFFGYTSFKKTIFRKGVNFNNSCFYKFSNFSDATFINVPNFSNVIFCETAFFEQDELPEKPVIRNCTFRNSHFLRNAVFLDRKFIGTADFSNATFHKLAKFHGSSFSTPPTFSLGQHFFAAPGKDMDWGKYDHTTLSQTYEHAFQKLKNTMESMGARTEANYFYSLEIKSRMQRNDISIIEKYCAKFYEFVSDYGQSISRPFIILLSINFFIWYMLNVATQDFSSSTAYILSHLFIWLKGINFNNSDVILFKSTNVIRYAATLSLTLLNLVLQFLALLALKRKFQIK